MENDRFHKIVIWEHILLALLFIAIGSIIMIVFSPWRPLLDPVNDYLGRISLTLLLLALVFLSRRSRRFKKYWQVFFGLLILIISVSLDWMISKYLIIYVGLNDTTPSGWALLKLNECVVVVSVIIILTKLSQKGIDTIYIRKGNLKLGLSIGATAFVLAALGSIPMATLFNSQNLSLNRIIPWTPWILIFVLSNASMEEIMFRGLFLQKLNPTFDKIISNLLVAFVFTFIHGAVSYTSDQYIFLAIVFPLALSWGYIMQKTNSVWGSILFHAGMDIPIILGIFSNL